MKSEQITQELIELRGKKQIPSLTEIQDWLIVYTAEMLESSPDEIDVTMLFDQYGLDSSMTVGMIGDLEVWLGCELDPTLIYDYSTIELLSQHLGSILATKN
uniref:PuwD n=1 Tax=Cylindrospermum alatosporum CCALA 988 TaxID=1382618 RepID=A0A0A0WGQ7_9NOST|nr:PuwD [Cylindrospermum alatosporum CCALA 988]